MSLGPPETPAPTSRAGHRARLGIDLHLQEAGGTNPRTEAHKMAYQGSTLDPGQAPPH